MWIINIPTFLARCEARALRMQIDPDFVDVVHFLLISSMSFLFWGWLSEISSMSSIFSWFHRCRSFSLDFINVIFLRKLQETWASSDSCQIYEIWDLWPKIYDLRSLTWDLRSLTCNLRSLTCDLRSLVNDMRYLTSDMRSVICISECPNRSKWTIVDQNG